MLSGARDNYLPENPSLFESAKDYWRTMPPCTKILFKIFCYIYVLLNICIFILNWYNFEKIYFIPDVVIDKYYSKFFIFNHLHFSMDSNNWSFS